MTTKIQRKEHSLGLTNEQIVAEFRTALEDNKQCYQPSEIEELVNIHAKSVTDNYMVYDETAKVSSIKQGDISLYGTETSYYKAVKDTINGLKLTNDRNLQDGTAITGDHKFVALPDSNLTIKVGMFVPKDNVTNGRQYSCKMIHSDKPFLITHREHGNVAVPAGDYLSFVQINPKTHSRVLD